MEKLWSAKIADALRSARPAIDMVSALPEYMLSSATGAASTIPAAYAAATTDGGLGSKLQAFSDAQDKWTTTPQGPGVETISSTIDENTPDVMKDVMASYDQWGQENPTARLGVDALASMARLPKGAKKLGAKDDNVVDGGFRSKADREYAAIDDGIVDPYDPNTMMQRIFADDDELTDRLIKESQAITQVERAFPSPMSQDPSKLEAMAFALRSADNKLGIKKSQDYRKDPRLLQLLEDIPF